MAGRSTSALETPVFVQINIAGHAIIVVARAPEEANQRRCLYYVNDGPGGFGLKAERALPGVGHTHGREAGCAAQRHRHERTVELGQTSRCCYA